jgi:hypothetical protein
MGIAQQALRAVRLRKQRSSQLSETLLEQRPKARLDFAHRKIHSVYWPTLGLVFTLQTSE